MSWEAGVMAMLGLTLLGGFAWYERSRPAFADRRSGGGAGSDLGRGAGRLLADPERGPDHRHHADRRLRPRPCPGVRGRCALWARLQFLARAGAVDSLADGGLGADRDSRRRRRRGERPEDRPFPARVDLRLHRLRLRCPARLLADGHLRRRAVARSLPGALGPRPPVQHRARRRQRRSRSGGRPRDDPDAAPLPAPVRVRLEQGCRRAEREERAGSPRGRPV